MRRFLLDALALALFILCLAVTGGLRAETFTCSGPCTVTITPVDAPVTCTLPAPAAVNQLCPAGQTGSIVTSFSCVGSTWTPSTTSTCASPPSGAPIAGPKICAPAGFTNFDQGVTYYFPLPKTKSGAGQVAVSAEGGVGTGAHLEASISRVAGDWTTAKAHAQTQSDGFGTRSIFPYYAQQGGYVSMPWASAANAGAAVVLPAETWYVNLRMTNLSGPLTVQASSPGCN